MYTAESDSLCRKMNWICQKVCISDQSIGSGLAQATRTQNWPGARILIYVRVPRKLLYHTIARYQPTQALKLFARQKVTESRLLLQKSLSTNIHYIHQILKNPNQGSTEWSE